MNSVEHALRTSGSRRGGFETIQPGDRSRIPLRRRVIAYVLAIVLPLATATAMIPFREDHGRIAVLVLVLPVVVVALLGASGPAIVAAASAVLAYDLFLTEPYYSESTHPILLPDGNLMGRMSELNPDRATLPEHLEIPVWVDAVLLGRFVLTPTTNHVASYEERITAATIAGLYGRAVVSIPPASENAEGRET